MACTIASNAGRRRDRGRQAERELRVEDGPVGQETGRDDTLLLGGGRRHDGDRRHLRARAGGRGHEQERQTLSPGQTDAIDVIELFVGRC